MLSLTITVSISRNSPRGPLIARIPIIAEIGKPMYSAGKSDAETEASAPGPPRHMPSDAAHTATSAVIRPVSKAPAAPLLATTAAVAKPDVVIDTARPLARASATSSFTASTATPNPTAKNTRGGANQTAAPAGARGAGGSACPRGPGIVQRDVEQHPGIPRRLADADLQLVLNVRRQVFGSADDPELDVVLEEGAELQADVPLEQHHQRVD